MLGGCRQVLHCFTRAICPIAKVSAHLFVPSPALLRVNETENTVDPSIHSSILQQILIERLFEAKRVTGQVKCQMNANLSQEEAIIEPVIAIL